MQFLASPVTGGGIQVNRFQQLFLLALSQGHKQPSDWAAQTWQLLQSQGHKQPSDWAAQTWQLLQSQGQRLIKDGQPIASETAPS